MALIAIIDHSNHDLVVEQLTDGQIQEYGDEQGWIDAHYDSENISWDYIAGAYFYCPENGDVPMEIDFENLKD